MTRIPKQANVPMANRVAWREAVRISEEFVVEE